MASIIKFFELNEKYRVVDLNKEWISTIKEFKKILTRDKGSKGDIEGRKKLQAVREFTFIYHYCDYASKFSNYSEEDKLKECLLNAELPENLDYTKDEDLLAALNKYKQLQETPALKALSEAKEGLHSAHKIIRKTRLYIEDQLANIDLSNLVNQEEEDKDGKKKTDPLTKLTTAFRNLISLINTIEPTLSTVENLEEKVKKELGDKTGLRGGREKGIKEDSTQGLPNREEKKPEEEIHQSTGEAGMFDDLL